MNLKHKNIRKIETGKGDDYATGWLLDYPYFKENYKVITIDLSKQQALDADPGKFNRLILFGIYIEQGIKQCFLLLKKQKKGFSTFDKEL